MEPPTLHAKISTNPQTRWTTSFLNALRQQGDPEADEALQMILRDGESRGIKTLFSVMDSNDEIPPSLHYPSLCSFFERTNQLPHDVDLDKIHRGEDVFEEHAFAGALALLAKSLPEGYQAPNLALVLNISGDLRTHTYRRLLGTLQTVVNVSTCRGFQEGGRAVITAQKLRLLHAGVRSLVPRSRQDYVSSYGIPVNQEDMLGTILGFSFLVIEGWRKLGVGLTPEQEEDYLYVWLTFARMMGMHPPGEPESLAYIPESVEDAAAFYRAYRRRHYVSREENPEGSALALAHQRFLRQLFPRPLRWLGFGLLPTICMQELMGEGACRRLGVRTVPGHPLFKFLLLHVHRLFTPGDKHHHDDHERLGMIFFNRLIHKAYGGRVTYAVPTDIVDMRAMVNRASPSVGS